MERYGKAIAAVLLAAVTATHALLADNVISQQEGVQIAIAAMTAFSVWLVPILEYPWMKTAVATTLAVLNALVTVIIDGIDQGDLVQIALSAATVVLVSAAPARSDPPPDSPPVTSSSG